MADADAEPDLCSQCGHPKGKHQLVGYAEAGEVPREVWIRCPVAGCVCHQTWSGPGGSAEGAEAAYRRFLTEQARESGEP